MTSLSKTTISEHHGIQAGDIVKAYWAGFLRLNLLK